MAQGKILLIDDEPRILSSLSRDIREFINYRILTAENGIDGLQILKNSPDVMVIVSDFKMPGMNGIQFFSEAHKISPDATRIMLTGAADLEMVIQAINFGQIFRFLLKPCSTEELLPAINAGIRQYQLITGEKELLDKTLSGSIKIMIDLLSALNPEIFVQSTRLRNLASSMAHAIQMENIWEVELTALLCRIGSVSVPQNIIDKWMNGYILAETEETMINNIPKIGENFVGNIPRLENVAKGIGYQNFNFDDKTTGISGNKIPILARILKIVQDFDRNYEIFQNPMVAFEELQKNAKNYDPELLNVFKDNVLITIEPPSKSTGENRIFERKINPDELVAGMVINRDIYDLEGRLIISSGTLITDILKTRLKNYFLCKAIKDPIVIRYAATS